MTRLFFWLDGKKSPMIARALKEKKTVTSPSVLFR